MKCKIQWIVPERGDVPTPDDNDACGWAIPFSGEGAQAFPICREHLARMPRTGWMFVDAHDARGTLALKLAEVRVVALAIRRAYPGIGKRAAEWSEILSDLFPCDNYYGFERWGMFVGVEPDGYIHT